MSDDQRTSGRRADRAGTSAPGRRGIVRPRKVDLLVVLGVLLPAVVVGALAMVGGEPASPYPPAPPSAARLTDASVACAAASSTAAGDVVVSRVPGLRGGEVAARVSVGDRTRLGAARRIDVRAGRLAEVPTDGDVVVTGRDAAAPGLVAGRTGESRAAAECRAPTFDEWYVGLGAAAKQGSTIELVNPDAGPAVVEIALYGQRGLVPDETDLRGIRVPGHSVLRFDVARSAPRRGTLAAHVTVVRGRVVTTVRHTYDPLGRAEPSTDFLPAQATPSTSNLLLGVPASSAGSLFVFNPGTDEVRATVRVVSDTATFTPEGLDDLVVPGGTVRSLPLSRVLTRQARSGAVGLEVRSAQPLVASARVLGDDLALFAPTTAVEAGAPTTAVVPLGPKLLVLGAATRSGVVRVTALDARGEVLVDAQRVEVGAGRGHRLELPDDAVLVTIESVNTPVAGTVVLTGGRLGALRLRPAEIDAEVPVVRPE